MKVRALLNFVGAVCVATGFGFIYGPLALIAAGAFLLLVARGGRA